MGGLGALMDKLPAQTGPQRAWPRSRGTSELRRQIAIIDSMTPRERRTAGIIDGSRRVASPLAPGSRCRT